MLSLGNPHSSECGEKSHTDIAGSHFGKGTSNGMQCLYKVVSRDVLEIKASLGVVL